MHHASSTCSRCPPEARPRVRASAACIHGARSAPRARELVVTPPLVAARAKSAPAARQGDMARAGYFLPSQSARPRREWLWNETAVERRGRFVSRHYEDTPSWPPFSPPPPPPRPSARVNAAPAAARRPRVRSPALTPAAPPGPSGSQPPPRSRDDVRARRGRRRRREFFDAQMVDEAGMLAASTFPIPPADLIAKGKLILAKNNGGEDLALLASDFKFVALVVGPLEKERFLAAFQSLRSTRGSRTPSSTTTTSASTRSSRRASGTTPGSSAPTPVPSSAAPSRRRTRRSSPRRSRVRCASTNAGSARS